MYIIMRAFWYVCFNLHFFPLSNWTEKLIARNFSWEANNLFTFLCFEEIKISLTPVLKYTSVLCECFSDTLGSYIEILNSNLI